MIIAAWSYKISTRTNGIRDSERNAYPMNPFQFHGRAFTCRTSGKESLVQNTDNCLVILDSNRTTKGRLHRKNKVVTIMGTNPLLCQ